MRRTIVDTADRVRVTDQVLIDGRWLLVEDITDAQTLAHPGRIALHVADPNGRTFCNDLDEPIRYVYAGETVTFRPGSTHLTGPTGLRPGGVQLADAHTAAMAPALKPNPSATRVGRRVWWRLGGDGTPQPGTIVVSPLHEIHVRIDGFGVVAATRSELFTAA